MCQGGKVILIVLLYGLWSGTCPKCLQGENIDHTSLKNDVKPSLDHFEPKRSYACMISLFNPFETLTFPLATNITNPAIFVQ